MQHLTKEEFLSWYPQFTVCPDEWLNVIFAQLPCKFNRCIWGCSLKEGESYYVAHYLTMRELMLQTGGDPDDPTSEVDLIAGAVRSAVTDFHAGSVGYSKDKDLEAKLNSDPYSRTVWGEQYEALKNSLAVGLVDVT